MYSGIRLFKTAFMNTRRQIYVSGIFLIVITFVLTVFLYLAESSVDPNFGFWDAFIWPYEKYLGDPGKVVDDPLMSPIGKIQISYSSDCFLYTKVIRVDLFRK